MHSPDSARPSPGVDDSVRDYLSAAARQQLDSLRATFDQRVDALEQALLDPARAASLVPLVLDLTRVATEEAEAVARQACLQTQLESQSAALAAVVADRSTIADLRKALEKSKAELDRMRDDLDRERERAAAGQRTLQEAEGRIAAAEARVAEADARADESEDHADEAEERAEALEQERAEWLGAQTQLTAQLERAKAAMAGSRSATDALAQQLAAAQAEAKGAEARAVEHETVRRRLESALREAEARVAATTAERDARNQDLQALRMAAEESNGRLDAMRRDTESQAVQFARTQEALAADLARLKQTVSARDNELATERSSFSAERAKLEEALRESDARALSATRDRDDAATRLASLQHAMSAKETEWSERLRALDQQWLKLASPNPAVERPVANAAAVAPVQSAPPPPMPAPTPAPTPTPVPPSTAAKPTAETPKAKLDPQPSAEGAKPKSKQAVAGTKPYVESGPRTDAAKPKAEPVPGLTVVPTPAARVATASVPSVEPEPLPASRLFEQESAESSEGVFSTVADALRAWTTETVELPAKASTGGNPLRTDPAPQESAAQPAAPALPPPQPTAYDTVRQAPRHHVADCRLSIHVDGAPADVVDLSQGGAQVVTPSMLKPGRQVKLAFQLLGPTAIGKAKVAWSKLEPPSSGSGMLQYRAGLTFTHVDKKIVDKLFEKAASSLKK